MTLNPQPTYPSLGSYVLKLHRDVLRQECTSALSGPLGTPRGAGHGRLRGRLEHIASGEGFEFADGDALIAALVQHVAALRRAAAGPEPGPPP